MKIFYYTLFLFVTLFTSCSKKKVVVPDNILNTEKMIVVLTDFEIAEAATVQNTNNEDTVNYTAAYYKFIFEKHKVKQADFERSMDWYAAHPDLLNKIYEEVINRLSKNRVRLQIKTILQTSLYL